MNEAKKEKEVNWLKIKMKKMKDDEDDKKTRQRKEREYKTDNETK